MLAVTTTTWNTRGKSRLKAAEFFFLYFLYLSVLILYFSPLMATHFSYGITMFGEIWKFRSLVSYWGC